jgi:hypothetical protein
LVLGSGFWVLGSGFWVSRTHGDTITIQLVKHSVHLPLEIVAKPLLQSTISQGEFTEWFEFSVPSFRIYRIPLKNKIKCFTYLSDRLKPALPTGRRSDVIASTEQFELDNLLRIGLWQVFLQPNTIRLYMADSDSARSYRPWQVYSILWSLTLCSLTGDC